MTEPTDGKLTRRKILSALGVAALTTSSVSVFGKQKKAVVASDSIRLFATAQEMQTSSLLKDGDIVQTAGFHHIGDGGQAAYIIGKARESDSSTIQLKNRLSASLLHVASVNYKMFGAVGDGRNDDGVQIKAAHEYANKHSIPVNNPHGEYWIKETRSIQILTNVEWGTTAFHIDETFNSRASLFDVQSDKAPLRIEFNEAEKKEFIKQLKPGTSLISMLAPYKNCLIIVEDKDDRIGFRAGPSYVNQSRPRSEFFYVEEHGRISGDLAWEFTNYTDLTAFPVSENFLTINGGSFYLSGNNIGTGYLKNGFTITRSRTIVKNQWVGLEPGNADESTTARSGFYTFSRVYNILLENVRLIPYINEREGLVEKMSGTYGLGAGYMLSGTFRNVSAEGGHNHWGVFGTNLVKDFRVENCDLNRVDVHFHCWNLTIRDSTIGYKGIAVTGGGQLTVENTSCAGTSFINFRRDFGSRWDGDIRITNCRFFPSTINDNAKAVLSYFPMDFDYKYPIGIGRSIVVDTFVIDYTNNESKATCWLIRSPSFSKAKHGERVFFPTNIEFRNVKVEGRDSGVRLINITDPQNLSVRRKGSYDGIQLEANARIAFRNIQLERLGEERTTGGADVHISLSGQQGADYADAYALYPEIEITDCKDVAADFGGKIAAVSITNCSVIKIEGSKKGIMPGKLSFSNTVIQPRAEKLEDIAVSLSTELGTSFTNCTVHSPMIGGTWQPQLLDRLDFIQINKTVRYNHLNTVLGNDILRHLQQQGIKLKPEFIAMLKSHHTLEDGNII